YRSHHWSSFIRVYRTCVWSLTLKFISAISENLQKRIREKEYLTCPILSTGRLNFSSETIDLSFIRLCFNTVAFSSKKRILKQHSNGHWTNTTRNWSDKTCFFTYIFKIYISSNSVTSRFILIWNSGNSDIDNYNIILHHFSLQIIWLPKCGNYNIRLRCYLRNIFSVTMS